MKLYLWGGRGLPTVPIMKDTIQQLIQKEGTTELLHIPFAGVGIRHRSSSRCMPKEFQPFIESLGVHYLDASYEEDIEAFSSGHIYINWGHYRDFLLAMCNKSKLLKKINNAEIIIAESSGAMVLGEMVLKGAKSWFEKGLWLVSNTIISPHYSTSYSKEEMKTLYAQQQAKTGYEILWIDETTFVEYEDGKYGEVIWMGEVYHL